jgi:UDP-N-acetylmuramate dehydrogenase
MSLKKFDLKQNYDLRQHTSIKIGGPASRFFIAHSEEELKEILKMVDGRYYLLGAGSNLLVKDTQILTPIIKLGEEFSYVRTVKDASLEVGSAFMLSKLMNFAIKNDLGGIENLAGIPATIGGLIAMNASAFGGAVSDCVTELEVMDRHGCIKRLGKKDVSFGYRWSSLRGSIILRAWMEFVKRVDVKVRVAEFLQARRRTQDLLPSCGCIFKNPAGLKAGFLIESCGFKGAAKNDAQVSPVHANFIINKGAAQYGDVDYLIKNIKEKVFSTFKVQLEEEVERWV